MNVLRHAFPTRRSAGLADERAATAPMGGSGWNRLGDKSGDATVRAWADALVATGLRDAGYLYVNIDDGWQGQRDANGVLQPNAKFPDMTALTEDRRSTRLNSSH